MAFCTDNPSELINYLGLRPDRNYSRKLALRYRSDQFGNRCCYCGNESKLTIDHFIPKSKGGIEHISNFLPACQPCNNQKGCKDGEQWYKTQSFFTEERWQKIQSTIGTLALINT